MIRKVDDYLALARCSGCSQGGQHLYRIADWPEGGDRSQPLCGDCLKRLADGPAEVDHRLF